MTAEAGMQDKIDYEQASAEDFDDQFDVIAFSDFLHDMGPSSVRPNSRSAKYLLVAL